MIEFTAWPKIARLNRDIVISEKIDGTNAAVGIADDELLATWETGTILGDDVVVTLDGKSLLVYAQSRSRIITPEQDNHGFARWVRDNAESLARTLGPGLHFGEWWGSGIQRGYGLQKGDKRFSLFNTKRWNDPEWLAGLSVPGLGVVPVLYEGPFDPNPAWRYQDGNPESIIDMPWISVLDELRFYGSKASPGFMNPEGIVMYHKAANEMFKVTLQGDEAPKGLAA